MGAVLLVKLFRNLQSMFNVTIMTVNLWTDSQIALYWIRGDSNRWKPWVRNRIVEIARTPIKLGGSFAPGTRIPPTWHREELVSST